MSSRRRISDVLTTFGLVVRHRDLYKTSWARLKDVGVRWSYARINIFVSHCFLGPNYLMVNFKKNEQIIKPEMMLFKQKIWRKKELVGKVSFEENNVSIEPMQQQDCQMLILFNIVCHRRLRKHLQWSLFSIKLLSEQLFCKSPLGECFWSYAIIGKA